MPKKFMPKKPAHTKAKAQPKRRAAPRRPARAARPLNAVVQGRAGQVSFSSAKHRTIPSKESKAAKAVTPAAIVSGSTGTQIGVISGTQSSVTYNHLGYTNMRGVLNQVIASSPAGGGVCRAIVTRLYEEMLFTNSTNYPVEMDLYDIVCKRDIPATIAFNAGTHTGYSAYGSPESYWATGLNAQQNLDPGALPLPQPYAMLTSLPTDSQLFNDFFKVTKKTRVMLAAAACHKHVVDISVHKYIDEFLANVNILGLKGYTTFTMVVVAGMPVALADSAGTTSSAASVNVIKSQRIKYHWVADNTYSSTFATNLAFNVANSTQLIINPVDGAPDVITTRP